MKSQLKGGRPIISMRECFAGVAAGALLALLTICPAAKAQQQPAPSANQSRQQSYQPNEQDFQMAPLSDLALENLDYVAASAPQIEDVLRKQSGLLVELEHWIARDATNHGQMVDEQEMSQEGIFDRLKRDRKFRAVATRLLQRYGYLQPEINPDSSLGAQQQLEMMAEAKRLQAAPLPQQPSNLFPAWDGNQAYPPGGQRPAWGPRKPGLGGNQPTPGSPQWSPPPSTPENPWINPPNNNCACGKPSRT